MRAGVHFNFQNYSDWARFEAQGTGQPRVPDQQIYEEDLHLAGLVEPLGFDSYWAIDHHFGPYIMTGGAIQHLTYMAGKTERIDFGTMVVVLPWYDPVVVAEQIMSNTRSSATSPTPGRLKSSANIRLGHRRGARPIMCWRSSNTSNARRVRRKWCSTSASVACRSKPLNVPCG